MQKAKIQCKNQKWIPAFAGMTNGRINERIRSKMSNAFMCREYHKRRGKGKKKLLSKWVKA